MRSWLAPILTLLQIFFLSPLWAENNLRLSPAEFDQVKPMLCDAETLEQLKVIKKTCDFESFTAWSEDLDGDAKPERIFFGPSGECGAHGNCPIAILKEEKGLWKLLNKPGCQDEGCLGWANAFASEVLPGRTGVFRDLLVGQDLGSFYWTKDVYQWKDGRYQLKAGSTSYYLVDSDVKLQKVSKARWEQCQKTGKNCL